MYSFLVLWCVICAAYFITPSFHLLNDSHNQEQTGSQRSKDQPMQKLKVQYAMHLTAIELHHLYLRTFPGIGETEDGRLGLATSICAQA